MLQKKCIFCIFLFKKHEIWRNKCFSHRRNLADGALRNHFITTARFMGGSSVKLSFPFSRFLGFRFPKGIKSSAGITARAYTLKHIQKDAL